MILINNDKIQIQEGYVGVMKEQKDHIQDELINFVKVILKSEDLLYQL